jgi:hypothetical protein
MASAAAPTSAPAAKPVEQQPVQVGALLTFLIAFSPYFVAAIWFD